MPDNECPIGYVPVRCYFEITYTTPEGRGEADYSLDTFWPGTPQVGQNFRNLCMPWMLTGPWVVTRVDVVHEGDGELWMQVYFDKLDLATKAPAADYVPSKAGFLDMLQELCHAGFYFEDKARWWGQWDAEEYEVSFDDEDEEDEEPDNGAAAAKRVIEEA